MKKQFMQALLASAGLILLGAGAEAAGNYQSQKIEKTAGKAQAARTEVTENKGEELVFWYEDADYSTFFAQAAEDYYEISGVRVQPVLKEAQDYMGEIYDTTMEDGAFPDVYLLASDALEEAYLYGLVSEQKDTIGYDGVCEKALAASTIENHRLGYPLSFNSCVFAYQNGYFSEEPVSLQAIIEYSNENEPPENIEYLLEWDVNDPFFDFPFIANSVNFEKKEKQVMQVHYDEALYEQDLKYFSGMLESFSIDADTIAKEKVIADFAEGKTLCAIIDTNSLQTLENCSYSLMQMPRLNEELEAGSCAVTDVLVVNDFSKEKQAASDFAEFVMLQESEKLWEMTGHYAVKKPAMLSGADAVAYESYENAVLVPASMDAMDFWITLEETIHKYF